ncbi:MAG: hypothetical protein M1830_003438 [Pleopsidium flavum]|nr:MAG: hypothetical protein M1830_003438 [Pleopsidium flavum]
MSSSSTNRQSGAIKGGTGTTSTPANSDTSERRRSSGSGKFAGLMSQKRNSGDMSATARKASFDEQKPAPGFLGGLWNR